MAALLVPFLLRATLIGVTFSIAYKQREPSAQLIDWLRAFVFETLAPIAFISIYGPFDKWLLRDSKPRLLDSPAKPLVLFVHGYVSNRGIWWRYVLHFQRRGYYVAAIDLFPTLGSIDDFVEQLERAIQKHQKLAKTNRTVLVAHSMGGLVCRAWQVKYGADNVELIVTIGSPHNGTKLAPFALGKCAKQMRQSSSWHHDLCANESAITRQKLVSIRSTQDNVVIPNASSILSGASNISFSGIGHLSTTTNRQIHQYVLSLIELYPDKGTSSVGVA